MPGAFEFAYDLNGPGIVPVVMSLPVAGSQTLKAGDPVVLSSKQVAKAGNGTGSLLGVMAQDSTNATANTAVRVYISKPGQVWLATATGDATSNVLDGTATYDLNSSVQINLSDTTGGCFKILGLGKTNTKVYVTAASHALS